MLRSYPGGIFGRQRRTVVNRKRPQMGEKRATQRRLGARYNNVRTGTTAKRSKGKESAKEGRVIRTAARTR
jgi:hypothetical protein